MDIFQRKIKYREVKLPVDVVRLLEKIETKYFFIVEKAYRELIKIAPKYEKQLAEYLGNLLEDESEEAFFSTLWLANVLGEIKSKEAIEPILQMIVKDNDYFSEEALFNLIKIGQKYKEETVEAVIEANEPVMNYYRERSEDFFEQNNKDGDKDEEEHYRGFRIFYYGILAEFALRNERAKNYLIQMFEEDDDYANALAYYLAILGDKRILELFKRRLEFMSSLGDENHFFYREIKCAYYILDKGKDNCDLFYDPWEKNEDWKESCFFRLNAFIKEKFELEKEEKGKLLEMEKEREENKKKNKNRIKFSNLSEEEFTDLVRKDNKKVKAHPISLFDFEKYVQIRQLGLKRENMEKILKEAGVSETAEDLQRIINKQSSPQDVVEILYKNNRGIKEDRRVFLEQAVFALEGVTPRTELNGLTPYEYDFVRENAEFANEQAAKTKAQKIGRNDPCPCGSGRKYKKCCMGK